MVIMNLAVTTWATTGLRNLYCAFQSGNHLGNVGCAVALIEAQEEASAMAAAAANWCEIATSKEVGLTDAEPHVFAAAFQQRA
jgi:hypothetical protein